MVDFDDISGIIEREKTGVRKGVSSFLKRAREKRAKSREFRTSERNRVERIREQESRKLERRFIRQKERQRLEKKFKVKRKTTVREGFLFGPQPTNKKKPGVTLF